MLKQLQTQIEKKAQSLLGGEMIYELTQLVQEFLYENNNPPSKSFHEQMLENNRMAELQLEQELMNSNQNVNKIDIEDKTVKIFFFFFVFDSFNQLF